MYVENYFKAGSFIELVPIGLPITLQYNISGNLEKTYIGYGADRKDVSDVFNEILISRDYIPAKISLTKGTSWVYGVLYTNDIPRTISGALPSCLLAAYETKFRNNPEQFRFFAGNIECTSVKFQGASHVTQYLHLCKFNVLPGWIVPPKMDRSVFDKWLNATNFSFKHIITDYIIFSKDKTEVVSTNIRQQQIMSVENYIDDNGYYRCAVTLDDDTVKYMPYADAAKFGLTKELTVYLDSHSCMFDTAGYTVDYADTIHCPYCGKVYSANLNSGEETICSDIHCTSRLIRPIQRFLTVMGMSPMTVEDIKHHIKDNTLTCIPDIFLILPYVNCELNVTVGKVLQAMIPLTLIKAPDVYSLFTTACSNDIKTIKYYINNPGSIINDLKINHPDANKLISWLSDDCNASDLTTILDTEQIHISQSDKFFDGAPIFRNKLIYITGEFIHGTTSEISAILQSYSARVTTTYTDCVDCVLVGGTNENVCGKNVVAARNMGIPIMTEQDFFAMYGIDSDLANLV